LVPSQKTLRPPSVPSWLRAWRSLVLVVQKGQKQEIMIED